MNDRTVLGLVLLNATESRIRQLAGYRSWYVVNRRWLTSGDDWRADEAADRAELRALVKLLRTARQLSAPVVERTDPVTVAKAADADLWAGDWYVYPAGVGQ